MRHRTSGLTLIETIIVIAIVIVVVSISVPVLLGVKKSVNVTNSISQMRQLYVALEIYRTDWGGHNGDYTYRGLALPYREQTERGVLGLPESIWYSPCGDDRTLFRTGPSTIRGWIGYSPGYYDDRFVSERVNPEYQTYLSDYRENAVVLVDHYCNEPGIDLRNPVIEKRALATLLSGEIVNTRKRGNAFFLHFYSEPSRN